jgi:uncharacterized protein
MNRSLPIRFVAAVLVIALAAFGPGLSGYEAAAQMRLAPAAETFSAPALGPSSIELPAQDALGAPAAPTAEGLAGLEAAPLTSAGGAASLPRSAALSRDSAPAALWGPLAEDSARAASWSRQSVRLAESLQPAARLGSLSSGSSYAVGQDLERALTRAAAPSRSGDVSVEETPGLGMVAGRMAGVPSRLNLAARGLSAAPEDAESASNAASEAAAFTRRVYDWMAVGLGVTAAAAYGVASHGALAAAIFSSPALLIGLVVAELGLVIGLGLALPKLPYSAAAGGFLLYSALNGVMLSSVLLVYAASSVVAAFGVTAGMFGGLAAFGHLTKKNLDGVGAYAGMALWGLILASVANLFLHSSGLSAALNYLGVLTFVGLTAFNAQKIRRIAESGIGARGPGRNLAIWGALTLYLDFINLFLYVLKIMGKAKEKK